MKTIIQPSYAVLNAVKKSNNIKLTLNNIKLTSWYLAITVTFFINKIMRILNY